MQTEHRIYYSDARAMSELHDGSINLVITSPPYPMIEMWDGQFALHDPAIGEFMAAGEGDKAFEAMHLLLDPVWRELYRVMKEGAIACINIGDTTRSVGGSFRLYANHARIQQQFRTLGFDSLPLVLWRKQTNAPNKFMGSGMLPAGAYLTLEHEYILLFRKGRRREFATVSAKANRRSSAFFWEERNTWFSDLWDFKGTRQETGSTASRIRSAAFPFTLPFRLVNMFSIFGDTVLDPFAGTGTTMLAAMAAGRSSIGYEIDEKMAVILGERIAKELPRLNRHNFSRIENHLAFVKQYQEEKGDLNHYNSYFSFPVVTGQEKELQLAFVESLEKRDSYTYRANYYVDELVQSLDPVIITAELR